MAGNKVEGWFLFTGVLEDLTEKLADHLTGHLPDSQLLFLHWAWSSSRMRPAMRRRNSMSASAHRMGSAEVAPMMEYPATESPMRNALVTGSPRMQDGEAVIGDEPGLGIAVDADTIQRYGV
jgi:hypothetical protein